VDIYFSDVFDVEPDELDAYGAFNISLVCDLPLFIDPFLLFNSANPQYRALHDRIIEYVKFLKSKAQRGAIPEGLLQAWFMFPEVKQNWFGYTEMGNQGHGLGAKFANALSRNLRTVFRDFGEERISHGSHLEKLTLVRSGIGRDNISDFTTNLIKEFLLGYTEEFAKTHIDADMRRDVMVAKVRFNYETETWAAGRYSLPFYRGDHVILTPRDILTKDDAWISHRGLVADFDGVIAAVPNAQLRDQINNYFNRILARRGDDEKEPTKREIEDAVTATVEQFPQVLDWFIRNREDRGNEARNVSRARVDWARRLFVDQVRPFILDVLEPSGFYALDSQTEARARVEFLKHVIEQQGGWRLFYVKGQRIDSEHQLQTIFKFVWFNSPMDVSPEANKGRGPVDFKVSRGAFDKILIEFKLAKNKHLEKNLQAQAETYEKAESHPAPPNPSLKVIVFMTEAEEQRVREILRRLGMADDPNIILIDARNDNKPPGSVAEPD